MKESYRKAGLLVGLTERGLGSNGTVNRLKGSPHQTSKKYGKLLSKGFRAALASIVVQNETSAVRTASKVIFTIKSHILDEN